METARHRVISVSRESGSYERSGEAGQQNQDEAAQKPYHHGSDQDGRRQADNIPDRADETPEAWNARGGPFEDEAPDPADYSVDKPAETVAADPAAKRDPCNSAREE